MAPASSVLRAAALTCLLTSVAGENHVGNLNWVNTALQIPACQYPNHYVGAKGGETLWDVASQRNLPPCALHALNPGVMSEMARGQAICVPGIKKPVLWDCDCGCML